MATKIPKTIDDDPSKSFSWFDNILFQRFSQSVSTEIFKATAPNTNSLSEIHESSQHWKYSDLIGSINSLTFAFDHQTVNDASKRILLRLFPPGLLPAYRVLFSPFPAFSAWMNTWVTHWTTNWLMGPSIVMPLSEELYGLNATGSSLLIEKCVFLEKSGCIQTCTHACKIPTQRFFLEEMALPVTLRPNLTDNSCRFDFGVFPLPLEVDNSLRGAACLAACTRSNKIKSTPQPALPTRESICRSSPSSFSPSREQWVVPSEVAVELALLDKAATTRQVPPWQLLRSLQRLQSLLLRSAPTTDQSFSSSSTLSSSGGGWADVEGALTGRWELVYSSLFPGGYFSVVEEVCSFLAGDDKQGFALDSTVTGLAWLPLRAVGRSQVVGRSEVGFSTHSLAVGSLFTVPLGGGGGDSDDNKKSKSYRFDYIGEELAVAQSSSGGVTLLKRRRD